MARTTFAHTTRARVRARARLGQCVLLLLLLLDDMRRICLSADKHARQPLLPSSTRSECCACKTSRANAEEMAAGRVLVTQKFSSSGVEINKHPGQKCVAIKANLIALYALILPDFPARLRL